MIALKTYFVFIKVHSVYVFSFNWYHNGNIILCQQAKHKKSELGHISSKTIVSELIIQNNKRSQKVLLAVKQCACGTTS